MKTMKSYTDKDKAWRMATAKEEYLVRIRENGNDAKEKREGYRLEMDGVTVFVSKVGNSWVVDHESGLRCQDGYPTRKDAVWEFVWNTRNKITPDVLKSVENLPPFDELPMKGEQPKEEPAKEPEETKGEETMKSNEKKNTKQTVYEIITDKIVDALNKGVIPWEKDWGGLPEGSYNRISKKAYSFLNQMLIAASGLPEGEYASFSQWTNKVKGKIVDTKNYAIVTYYKQNEKPVLDENGEPVLDDEGKPKVKTTPILRYYKVYHVSNVDGVKPLDEIPAADIPDSDLDRVLTAYYSREGVNYHEERGDKAFYRPGTDEIVLPLKRQFKSAAGYLSTKAHETIHSTSKEGRCGRAIDDIAAFGSTSYAKEELVAEIGAAFLMGLFGMNTEKSDRNTEAYCQNWARVLKSNPRWIVQAAQKAEKAVKYILAGYEPPKVEEPEVKPEEPEAVEEPGTAEATPEEPKAEEPEETKRVPEDDKLDARLAEMYRVSDALKVVRDKVADLDGKVWDKRVKDALKSYAKEVNTYITKRAYSGIEEIWVKSGKYEVTVKVILKEENGKRPRLDGEATANAITEARVRVRHERKNLRTSRDKLEEIRGKIKQIEALKDELKEMQTYSFAEMFNTEVEVRTKSYLW